MKKGPYRARTRRTVLGAERMSDPFKLTAPAEPRVPVPYRVNRTDRLTGNDRSKLPLTLLQAETLDALTDELAGPKAIASRCSLSPRQVASALWALAAKGQVLSFMGGVATVRTPEGRYVSAEVRIREDGTLFVDLDEIQRRFPPPDVEAA